MEIVAWATHKYIMHGFLWVLHKDHHKKDHDSWFERNDLFFLQFAGISAIFVVLWGEYDIWYGLPIAIGIFFYGLAYFIVHDIFIHRRFKIFKNINHWYARGIRKGHKVHHKHPATKHVGHFPFAIFNRYYNKKNHTKAPQN